MGLKLATGGAAVAIWAVSGDSLTSADADVLRLQRLGRQMAPGAAVCGGRLGLSPSALAMVAGVPEPWEALLVGSTALHDAIMLAPRRIVSTLLALIRLAPVTYVAWPADASPLRAALQVLSCCPAHPLQLP